MICLYVQVLESLPISHPARMEEIMLVLVSLVISTRAVDFLERLVSKVCQEGCQILFARRLGSFVARYKYEASST